MFFLGTRILALALALAQAAGGLGGAASKGPPEHFLIQSTSECSFLPPKNGSGPDPGGVHFVERYIYDREEYVRFDSEWGEYRAISLLGEPDAKYWNSRKEVLEDRRAQVDVFCRRCYEIDAPFFRSRKVKPRLKITPTEEEEAFPGHTLLICTVAGFWPSEVEVRWFRNGKEEEGPQVMTTDLIRNGDWTFQIKVMLVTKPEQGDVYACQVEHASFASPASVQWEPQSDSARSKMWTGVAGIILGLAFLAPGLLLYLKNRKGDVLPQPPAALMS